MSRRRRFGILAVLTLLVTLTGCAEKIVTPPPPPAPVAAPPAEPVPVPSQPSVAETPARPRARPPAPEPASPPRVATAPAPALATAPATAPAPVQRPPDFVEQPALKDVFFDRGRVDIGRDGAEIMRGNARWLLENPGHQVLIEGHADYLGAREFNLTVGERRARAAKNSLLKEGVAEGRLQTVSYGADRPVCGETTEACAAKNRRVHFLVRPQ